MGNSQSIPDIDGYPLKKVFAKDPTYGNYAVYGTKDNDRKPLALLCMRYETEDMSDKARLTALLDMRNQISDGQTQRVYKHEPHGMSQYLAWWDYPFFTLENELRERRMNALDFVKLTRVNFS